MGSISKNEKAHVVGELEMILRSLNSYTRAGCLMLFVTVCTANAAILKTRLNNLELGIDDRTGGIVFLSYPPTGVMIETSPESAGLIDLAYPIEAFAPMRLAARFSQARVVKEVNGVTITWDALGPSRSNFPLPQGRVSAQVTIRAAG